MLLFSRFLLPINLPYCFLLTKGQTPFRIINCPLLACFLLLLWLFIVIPVQLKDGKSIWKKILLFICGMSSDGEDQKKSAEEQREHLKEVISLKQNRIARLALRANLAVILTIAVFLFIFFSVPDGGPTAPTIPYGRNTTIWINVSC